MLFIVIPLISLVLTVVLIVMGKVISSLIKLYKNQKNKEIQYITPLIVESTFKSERLIVKYRVNTELLRVEQIPEEWMVNRLVEKLAKDIVGRCKVKKETYQDQVMEHGHSYLRPGEVEYTVGIVVGVEK